MKRISSILLVLVGAVPCGAAFQKNVSGQKVTVLAIDSATGRPKTGDAGNITVYEDLDDAGVTVLGDTTATEKDATNAKGLYVFDLSSGETNANKIVFSGKSATTGVDIVPFAVYTQPVNFAATSIDSNGRLDVIKLAGTTQTARDIGASVLLAAGTSTGQLDFSGGVVKANVTQSNGTANASTAGYFAPDWGHVNAQSTGVSLSGTTIGTVTTSGLTQQQTRDAMKFAPSGGSPAAGSVDSAIAATEQHSSFASDFAAGITAATAGAPDLTTGVEDALTAQGYTTALAGKLGSVAPSLLLSTTISGTPTSPTTFALAAGPADNNALDGSLVIVTDGSGKKAVGVVKSYVGGSSHTVTLMSDPSVFTLAAGNSVDFIADGASVSRR
jgi:hypothetical protein